MTKILRITMVQTITIDQIIPAKAESEAKVGPIVGDDLAKIRAEAEAEAQNEQEAGIVMSVNDLTAEVVEV